MIPAGGGGGGGAISNLILPGNVETRSGLEEENLDREFIITGSADDGTCISLGIGRLIIGKTGGGERPCGGCSKVGEEWVNSNRRETDDGEGAPP